MKNAACTTYLIIMNTVTWTYKGGIVHIKVMLAQGTKGIALLILYPAPDGGHQPPSCPSCITSGKNPSTSWIRGWVGPRNSLDFWRRVKPLLLPRLEHGIVQPTDYTDRCIPTQTTTYTDFIFWTVCDFLHVYSEFSSIFQFEKYTYSITHHYLSSV